MIVFWYKIALDIDNKFVLASTTLFNWKKQLQWYLAISSPNYRPSKDAITDANLEKLDKGMIKVSHNSIEKQQLV